MLVCIVAAALLSKECHTEHHSPLTVFILPTGPESEGAKSSFHATPSHMPALQTLHMLI